MLKYLRRHPVERITVAGGLAKMTKLAQGMLDLHSKRGAVDLAWLGQEARHAGADEALIEAILRSNTAAEAFGLAETNRIDLAGRVAAGAHATAATCLGRREGLAIVLFDREGRLLARAG